MKDFGYVVAGVMIILFFVFALNLTDKIFV